ncbi:MAG: hypothetical protein Q9160_005380 [Pyrenula sp. 1 TL-2023]
MPLGMMDEAEDMAKRMGDEGSQKTDLEMFGQGLEWALKRVRKGGLKELKWLFGPDTSDFRHLLSSHASTLESLSLTLDIVRNRLSDQDFLQRSIEAEESVLHLLPQFTNIRSLSLRSMRWIGSWQPLRACLQANQMRLERLALAPTHSIHSPSMRRPPATVYALRTILGETDEADNDDDNNDGNERSSRLKPEPALSFPRLESLELGSIDLTPWRPRTVDRDPEPGSDLDLAPNPDSNSNSVPIPLPPTTSSQASAPAAVLLPSSPPSAHLQSLLNLPHLTSLTLTACTTLTTLLRVQPTPLRLRNLSLQFLRSTRPPSRLHGQFIAPHVHYPEVAAGIAGTIRNASETLERAEIVVGSQMGAMRPFLDQVWEALGCVGDGYDSADSGGGLKELVWQEPPSVPPLVPGANANANVNQGLNGNGNNNAGRDAAPTPTVSVHASPSVIAEALRVSKGRMEFLGISDGAKRVNT